MKTRAKSGVAELLSGQVDGLQPLLMSLSPCHPFALARFGAPNPPAVRRKFTSSWPGVCDRVSLPTHLLLKLQPSAFTKTPLFHSKALHRLCTCCFLPHITASSTSRWGWRPPRSPVGGDGKPPLPGPILESCWLCGTARHPEGSAVSPLG